MEYLCFANGRKKDECVKIYEGQLFMIDRLTVNYQDSDAIRKKFAKEFREFQSLYPNGSKGSVRIYGDSITSENGKRVLYLKHKEAFKYIIEDKAFLRWLAEGDLKLNRSQRIIYDTYVLNGITRYNKELTRINQFIEAIKRDDRNEFGVRGGAKRYYRFMREVLFKYEEYSKTRKGVLTIDQLWKKHIESKGKMKVQSDPIMDGNIHAKNEQKEEEPSLYEIIPGMDEVDPDRIYLGEEPLERESIYSFFQSDYFDRYYSKVFENDEMMVLGEFSLTHDPTNIAPWASIANTCFNGNVTAVDLEHFSYTDSQFFESSKIITLIGESDTRMLKTMIIRALENKAQVILISDDKELLNAYSKKFKNIIPIYNDRDDSYTSQKAYVDFFVEQYQNARGGYSKK